MKSTKKSKKKRTATGSNGSPNKFSRWPIYLLITVGLVVLAFLVMREWPTPQGQAQLGSNASSSVPGSMSQVLKGRWLRPDGGYVLEIGNIGENGRIEARYFNPRPINVAKAEMSQAGPTTKVFVELRDTGYPGSTYNLVYDSASDQLKGIYTQAAIQQTFDVYFIRI